MIQVISRILPQSIESASDGEPVWDKLEKKKDNYDEFNHPRLRQALIITALKSKYDHDIRFEVPSLPKEKDLSVYNIIHSSGLIEFLFNAWERWDNLGEAGQDPAASIISVISSTSNDNNGQEEGDTDTMKKRHSTPPLIPINVPLPRVQNQRPSTNVMGQIGYYCTDLCTPIFDDLITELAMDAAILQRAMELSEQKQGPVYALTTHPGHHAGKDSFGGYCYVNHAAFVASSYLKGGRKNKLAILDVDYHCGNGTIDIFDDNPNVLVVSIHCHPDYDYPFHSGFADETGEAGTTLNLPLMPGTRWNKYKTALEKAIHRIKDFEAEAMVVSLGLDTHKDDPCCIRRAGFALEGDDYYEMGKIIGLHAKGLILVFIQEGGYRMDKIGEAAADVLAGCWSSYK